MSRVQGVSCRRRGCSGGVLPGLDACTEGHPVRASKYGVAAPEKRTRDGITFHSALEAERWDELQALHRAGAVDVIVRQPAFALAGAIYRADFLAVWRRWPTWRGRDFPRDAVMSVERAGSPLPGVVETTCLCVTTEDVKGARTAAYKRSIAQMAVLHPRTVIAELTVRGVERAGGAT